MWLKRPLLSGGVSSSDPPLLSRDVENVVAPEECVPVLVLELPVDVLLSLLERDVHVAVEACKNPTVVDTRVEFHHDRTTEKSLQKVVRVLAYRHDAVNDSDDQGLLFSGARLL